MMLIYELLIVCVGTQVLAKPFEFIGEVGEIVPFPNKLAPNRTQKINTEELEIEFWKKNAVSAIKSRLQLKHNLNTAKNVILFLGDGMSIPTITATRIYLGGEEKQLSFEKFPYTALSKTYCVDHQVADSACSATAYLGGVKANLGTIGVSPAVTKKNCTAMNNLDNHVFSIARQFQLKGRRTGLVTTTRVTHASPAGVYAHTAFRDWESDTNVLRNGQDPNECADIAKQLVFGETGQNLNVVLGGGRKKFLPVQITDEEGQPGERSDHISLIEEWRKLREEKGQKAEFLWNRQQLLEVKNDTEYILGLFESDHMKYNLERDQTTDPSLAEMTEAAIKLLSKNNPNGFFLFVEGGAIDLAHHVTWAQKALDETAELAKAVQKATEITNEEDTLIVVTSDHAHTMSVAGYASRGSDILGYAGEAEDKQLYTIINYANGPGYQTMDEGKRFVPSEDEMHDMQFRFQSIAPLKEETHGGDDVGIFARGPWSHLFTGVMEENVIPHLMSYAACVSNELPCDDRKLA